MAVTAQLQSPCGAAAEAPSLTLVHAGRSVQEVRLDDRLVPMSPLERQLLGLLAWRPEVPVSRVDLMQVLGVGPAVLKNTVCRLRKRLPDPGWVRSLRALRSGVGVDGFAYSLGLREVRWLPSLPSGQSILVTGRLPDRFVRKARFC